MINKNNKVYVEWSDVEKYIECLSALVVDKGFDISGIYGLPRGGLVLATMLSYKLDVPLLQAPAKNCIIVDDIADSGKSLSHYRENDTQFNHYFIATVFFKDRSIVEPDFYMFKKQDEWIVFPWEFDS